MFYVPTLLYKKVGSPVVWSDEWEKESLTLCCYSQCWVTRAEMKGKMRLSPSQSCHSVPEDIFNTHVLSWQG